MKTQGEIEAEVSKGVNQIYLGLLGRGAKNIQTNVLGATVLVVLQNVLTAAEIQVAKTPEGRKIIKEMCCAVVANSQVQFIAAVTVATGEDVIDMHHDISIKTGKEILVFSLANPLTCRKSNGK
jgi:uncharacterized protein YbcI